MFGALIGIKSYLWHSTCNFCVSRTSSSSSFKLLGKRRKVKSSIRVLKNEKIPNSLKYEPLSTSVDFEPYKPLLESKNYPSVKVWVLQQRGDEMLVKLEDLTVHIRLIHQVYFKLIHATTNGTFLS